MKKILTILLSLLVTVNFSACDKDNNAPVSPPAEIPGNGNDDEENNEPPNLTFENMKLKITIGNNTLTATLADNPTARDFVTLLPITVKLDDYAGTEKVFYPERKLSTQSAPAGIDPDSGDITYYSPWGNIAIFYKDFGYSRGLVPIAKIDGTISPLQVSGSINNVRFEAVEK